MPLSVTCGCGHKFRVDDGFAGKQGPCPACGQTIDLKGPTVPQFDVFLSYSSKDKTIADAAVAILEQRGLRCWVAPRNIVAGKEWGESIIEGIENSGLMVLVFSQHSNQSQQVIREVERAVAKGIPIIPFRIEDIPASKAMEYFISCHHWLDALDPPLERHLAKLADMAGHLLGNAPPPKSDADDAKGVAGKLQAAVGTLLARDKRIGVLTALAALLVVAALIVAASGFFRGRERVASPELIAAKAEAEVLAKQVHQLDPGQGLAEKIAAVDQEQNAAASLYADKQFEKSLAAYQKMLGAGRQVVEVAQQRTTADDKRTSMQTALKVAETAKAQQFASTDWENAKKHADQADVAYAKADFATAAEHWNNASAAYTAAADAAKKSSLPRIKALAFWTSMSVNNKWWFETLRPAPPALEDGALGGLGSFQPAPGFLPAVRSRTRSGGPSYLRAQAEDWPPYQATVRKGTAFLDIEAREDLGIDGALIDRLIDTDDLGILEATTAKVVEQIKTRHGPEVEWAYRLGTNVAKLKTLCDLGAITSEPYNGSGLKPPKRADIIWSTDYVMHRTLVVGGPQEIIDTVKEMRRLYDERSDGLWDGDWALTFAVPQMKLKFDALYAKYFATPEVATAMFAACQPPADPPQFPSRSEADNERLNELERQGAWLSFDLERFDRPPVSIVFHFEGSLYGIKLDVDTRMADAVKFPHLRRLGLHELPLEDKHLALLPPLAELRELIFSLEKVTPAGMEHVAKIPQLDMLWLYDVKAPAEAIAPLAACQRLTSLGVSRCENFDDDAAEAAAKIKTLEKLQISESAVTDKGVEHLKSLDKLITLDLNEAKVTDASAPLLAELVNLEQLYLRETGLTDDSLPHLKKLTKLKELVVSNTKITKEGTAELKLALPMCDVSGN